jgi:class 3 adenylate cyclase
MQNSIGSLLMSSELRELLKNAEGKPQLVIAVNADVRGFSPFSKRDSYEVALFIKKVYIKLIDQYFTQASFIKPTGDGLLVVIHFTETNYREVMTGTIKTCLAVLRDFPSFFSGEDAVRYEVPMKIGIGLSSGTVCRLVSGDPDHRTIDYSGKTVNLASRLMEFARPSGIVFDSSVGFELLAPELAELFVKDKVCVRGIAEDSPIDIYHTMDTVILASDREPRARWHTDKKEMTVRLIRYAARRASSLGFDLATVPADVNLITVRVIYDIPEFKREGKRYIIDMPRSDFSYSLIGAKPEICLEHLSRLATTMDRDDLKDEEIVLFEITYPVS